MNIDLEQLTGSAKKVLGPNAPAPARMMAAKGIIPGAKPADIVTVVAVLSRSDDEKVARAAGQTLAKLPPPVMTGALGADLQAPVIAALAERYSGDHEVVAKLVRMPRIDGEALELLASRADEKLGELIATNEARLLQLPTVIEKLYLNKRVRMSTADRLLELAVRNDVKLDIPAFEEAAAAIQNELIPEATEEPTFDDVLFAETDAIAEQTAGKLGEEDDTHEVDDEGEERLREDIKPLYQRINEMTVSQKIRRATVGTAAERLLLVRDPVQLVAMAAVKSPAMRENEAVRISASRSVSEGVLREISKNREFTRSYQVKLNLIQNPRAPFMFTSRFIGHLRDNDLKTLSRSKNIPGAVQKAVKQQLLRKQGASKRR